MKKIYVLIASLAITCSVFGQRVLTDKVIPDHYKSTNIEKPVVFTPKSTE